MIPLYLLAIKVLEVSDTSKQFAMLTNITDIVLFGPMVQMNAIFITLQGQSSVQRQTEYY